MKIGEQWIELKRRGYGFCENAKEADEYMLKWAEELGADIKNLTKSKKQCLIWVELCC